MKSFRLQFIDIDSSYTISTTTTAIKGFMVVRAPKGTEEAQFFQAGNEKHIDSMLGVGNANWPDLKEAVAFNEEYDLYISAPAGTSSKYPSYYGGVYLTKYGLYDFWRVTDGTNPSYEVRVNLGKEDNFDAAFAESKISFGDFTFEGNSYIKIENISAALKAKVSYFNFIWAGKEYIFHIDGEDVYTVRNDKDIKQTKSGEAHAFGNVILQADGTYTIILGANKNDLGGYTLVTPVKGEPTLDLNSVTSLKSDFGLTGSSDLSFSINAAVEVKAVAAKTANAATGSVYYDAITGGVYLKTANDWVVITESTYLSDIIPDVSPVLFYSNDSENTTIGNIYVSGGDLQVKIPGGSQSLVQGFKAATLSSNDLRDLYISGFSGLNLTAGSITKQYSFSGLKNMLFWRVNIKDETALVISQKSPNETPTSITLSNIGYDKYLYNKNVKYITKAYFDTFTSINEEDNSLEITSTLPANLIAAIALSNTDMEFVVIDTDNESIAVYRYEKNNGVAELKDVTAENKTSTLYISGSLEYNGTVLDSNSNAYDAYYKYTLWYVEDTGVTNEFEHTVVQMTNDEDAEYTPKVNVGFNTFTFSCKEEVYLGSYNDGGEWTGSTNPKGQDAQGSNIYFPNILPQDSVTYVNVIPVHTFEELGLVNTEGFWTGKKIVDKIGPADDTYTFTISGQRFCSYVNNMNIAEGKLGCAWRDEYEAIINAGLIEAQSNVYDDALVFMEPTGQECFKSKLMALRTTYHDTSTIISPKIINQAEFNNPKSIVIAGRSTGTAQYIGEFKMYDSYTGQYYWCQPIGDVGKMLARIMDKKLGGIAPAGTNNTQGLGGVLSRAVLSAKWNFVDSQLKIMDEKGVNAITYDADNGLMMQSQKTTQDPQNVTDWSYLGHSMSFDLCKREIRDKVMVPQLFKRINDYYMNIRQAQVDDILAKRTTGNDPIWASAECSIKPVNTATTMAKRQFVMKVTCKVYVYSESCLLMFENLSQQ